MKLSAPLFAGTAIQEQIELETMAVADGVRHYRRLAEEAIARGDGASLKPAERLALYWFEPLSEEIAKDQRAIRRGEKEQGRAIHGPPMLQISAERMTVIVLHNILGACMSDPRGELVARLAYSIGRDVFAELALDELARMQSARNAAYRERVKDESEDRTRQPSEEAILDSLTKRTRRMTTGRVNWWGNKHLKDHQWSRKASAHVGMRLLWLAIGYCGLRDENDNLVPAIIHRKRNIGGKTKAFVAITEQAMKIINEGHEHRELMRPRFLPMIVPPCPWQKAPADDKRADMGAVGGGYVQIRTPFVSKPTTEQKEAVRGADMAEVYECLNAVNATAWRIHEANKAAIEARWEAGGGELGIPLRDEIPIPPPVESTDPKIIKAAKKDRADVYRANVQGRAERQEFLQRLGVAKRFALRNAIYYPHQIDFRGRAYPIPPHLNHQGDDVCRGLMEFADAVQPGNDGDWWLYIHAANCYGIDKVSFDERVEWTKNHIPQIVDSLNGGDFWKRADNGDKPWQFLAACRALVDPEAAAHLPVQVDGSANGLQWYAALGLDEGAAAIVNLIPGDKPGNLYGSVANTLRATIESEGSDISRKMLEYVTRDTVKQPVMTFNYGVTLIGARQQIRGKLNTLGVTGDDAHFGSQYLAKRTLDSVATLFPIATAIMGWLRECAAIIVEAGHSVRWVTPLGLPVVQPYRNYRRCEIETILQTLTLRVEDSSLPVKVQRQINGCPPNFVHSLDATHMLMTARACRDEGIPFAAVHDSYWAHAANMPRLNQILREQFVALASRNLLLELHQWWTKHYQMTFPEPPQRGTLDIRRVLDSEYFFH